MSAARKPAAVPMVDVRAEYRSLEGEIRHAVTSVLEAGQYILGPRVAEFEDAAASYLGVRHAVGVASGSDALELALLAAGIGPGDEVITTPFTFVAAAQAILHAGARPVFADIREETFNLDPDLVEEAVTPATRAILPVHLYGLPCDMGRLTEIAERHGLAVIEDCAQSFGATLDGRQTGGFGVAGCFSFYPTKNLACCGDGGLVTTSDDGVAERLRSLRTHGSVKPRVYVEPGFNSRLDEIQAAILLVKLARLDGYNARRRAIAQAYDRDLAGLPVRLPAARPGATHVYHQYTLLCERRDEIAAALSARDIASAVHYAHPLHRQPLFAEDYGELSLPVAERVAERCLCLPMSAFLDDEQVGRVIEAVRECLEDRIRSGAPP